MHCIPVVRMLVEGIVVGGAVTPGVVGGSIVPEYMAITHLSPQIPNQLASCY